MVEAGGADVVGPAVAADQPHAAPHEVLDDREQRFRLVARQVREAAPQLGDALPLRPDPALAALVGGEDLVDELRADLRRQRLQEVHGHRVVLVGGEAQAEAELGVVLEQRVRPGGAAPFGVLGPRRGREVAAVDRGAAGRVGDDQAVAEQLRDQLDVGRLAAAGAGARELEQGLQELGAAHGREVDPRPVVDGQGLEEADGGALRLEVGRLVAKVDRLDAGLLLALRRADLDAEPAAGAVLDVDLQRVARLRKAARVDRRRSEARRRALRARSRGRTWSGSRCAGRRSCSCRTGCRCPAPTPARSRRCCASRRRRCRTARCRPRAAPRPGARRRARPSSSRSPSRTNSGASSGTSGGRGRAVRRVRRDLAPRAAARAPRRPRRSSCGRPRRPSCRRSSRSRP